MTPPTPKSGAEAVPTVTRILAVPLAYLEDGFSAAVVVVLASDFDRQSAELAVWQSRAEGIADVVEEANLELQRLSAELAQAREEVWERLEELRTLKVLFKMERDDNDRLRPMEAALRDAELKSQELRNEK